MRRLVALEELVDPTAIFFSYAFKGFDFDFGVPLAERSQSENLVTSKRNTIMISGERRSRRSPGATWPSRASIKGFYIPYLTNDEFLSCENGSSFHTYIFFFKALHMEMVL